MVLDQLRALDKNITDKNITDKNIISIMLKIFLF